MAPVNLYPNPFDLFRLATFVLTDHNPGFDVDAAYLFGHTPDNQQSTLDAGAHLWWGSKVNKLAICGGGPYVPPNSPSDAKIAYSGADAWRSYLVQEKAVSDEDIIEIPRPPLAHTGTEAYNLAVFAKESRWKVINVVSWPAHMLRTFANMVAAVNRVYPELIVYCRVGTTLPWHEHVLSSQGTVEGTRFETVMEGEWNRLNALYGNEYDLASAEEMLAYIHRRVEWERTVQVTV